MIARILSILIGYACGLFQTSYIYGKLHGVDIRKVGSGNAGTTNALRAFGSKVGILVFAGDCAKCVVAVLLVRALFGPAHPEIRLLLGMYGAFGCILGHNFPFYMNFKGGKGIACTAGAIVAFRWELVPICLLSFFGPAFLTHYVSLGSLILNIVFPAGVIILGQSGRLGMSGAHLTELYILVLVMAALAFFQHRANIGRLLKGTERKTYLFKKK